MVNKLVNEGYRKQNVLQRFWTELKLRTVWSNQPLSDRRALTKIFCNVLIGLGIGLILILSSQGEWKRNIEDKSADLMMKYFFAGTLPTGDDAVTPFTFLDIDERSYREWNEPLLTPRNKLKTLIEYAVNGQAALVIVDIDLSRGSSGKRPPVNAQQLSDNDKKLKEYLEQHYCKNIPCQNVSNFPENSPPIIFVRAPREPLLPDENCAQLRPSFLDDVVKYSPDLYWAVANFVLDRDETIRRWHLWKSVCTNNCRFFIPSVQLLAATIIQDQNAGPQWLNQCLPICAASYTPRKLNFNQCGNCEFEFGTQRIVITRASHRQRVFYSLPWKSNSEEGRPMVRIENESVPVLTIQPAITATEVSALSRQPSESGWFKHQIVVIGGSYTDSRDIYQTPLEEMPGALVIINAIHSMLSYGSGLKKLPVWGQFVLQTSLILVMIILFTILDSFRAKHLISISIILTFPIISYVFGRCGIWIDYSIPLAIVAIFELAAEVLEVFRNRTIGN